MQTSHFVHQCKQWNPKPLLIWHTSHSTSHHKLSIIGHHFSLISLDSVVLRDASSGWLLSVLQAAGAGCTCAGPTGTTMTETQERGEGGGLTSLPIQGAGDPTRPGQTRALVTKTSSFQIIIRVWESWQTFLGRLSWVTLLNKWLR